MQRSAPFARFTMMMGAIAAAMAGGTTQGAQAMSRKAAVAQLPAYESRGKGQGRSNRIAPGAQMANIRAARKARNVKRHRKACRG